MSTVFLIKKCCQLPPEAVTTSSREANSGYAYSDPRPRANATFLRRFVWRDLAYWHLGRQLLQALQTLSIGSGADSLNRSFFKVATCVETNPGSLKREVKSPKPAQGTDPRKKDSCRGEHAMFSTAVRSPFSPPFLLSQWLPGGGWSGGFGGFSVSAKKASFGRWLQRKPSQKGPTNTSSEVD